MKRTLKLFVLGLVAAGLLTGCPKEAEEPKEEPKQEEPAKAEEPKEEPKEEEPKEEEPAKAEVDKEMFIKAAYEVTCVRAKVEDTETQKAILAEVYPRYGFTEETFTAAEGQLKDETTVQEAIKSKMEACTPEVAAAFKTAGADAEAKEGETKEGDAEAKAEEKKPAAKPAVQAGKYKGGVSGGGIEGGKMEVTVGKDLSIYAKFEGKREGKKVIIPLKGNLSKDGAFTLTGKSGANRIKAEGKIGKGVAAGRISGSVNRKPLKSTFNAKL